MEVVVVKPNIGKYIEDDKQGEVEVCKAEKVQDDCSCIVLIVVLVTRHDTGAGAAYELIYHFRATIELI